MSASSVTEVEIEPVIPSEIPADFQYFFKRPPLLNEEDPIEYWMLVRQFIQHVSPKAVIQWIWLKDVADHTWEIWRLRRLRAVLVRQAPAWGRLCSDVNGVETRQARHAPQRKHCSRQAQGRS